MLNPDFFSRLGLFVRKNFLDAELCADLRSETSLTTNIPAKISNSGTHGLVDERRRRTQLIKLSASKESFIRERLLAIKPAVENHFNLKLTDCVTPHLLTYKKGDFFKPHRDGDTAPDAPKFVRERRLSAIIFLNNTAKQPTRNSFCGGKLVLYGLIDHGDWKTYGFPIESEEGMLILFNSGILHEVKPVTSGERYTIVSWFTGP